MKPKEFCEKYDACSDGAAFALKYETMRDVWDNCPRADWMIWIMNKMDIRMDDKNARLFACWCVQETPLLDGRKTWDLLTDERSRNAVNVALRFARDEANSDELAAASAAAWDAASAASWDAAWDAASAASWDAARDAARAANAAWAAARAAAWDAARDAASAAANAAQSVKFREFFPNPFPA